MSITTTLDTTRYPFDLACCVVADVETYPGRWCVGFHGPNLQGEPTTWLVDGNRDHLAKVLTRLGKHQRILVTYNGDHFDVPVIRAILGGFDAYTIGQTIVDLGRSAIPLSELPKLHCAHIDLAARLRRGGRFPSLKRVAAYLGRPTLRELPFEPGSILTDEQWAEVKAYNRVDLDHTWALLDRFGPELEALAALSEEQGQDLRSVPTPRVVERVFLNAYKRERGVEPTKPETPHEVIYRGVAGVRRPRTPEAAEWYDRVVDRPIPLVGQDDRRRADVPRAQFTIGRLRVTVGSGGLHSTDAPRLYYATRKYRLISVDVASFYPSLIATKGISPRAYGDCGAATYRGVLERRLEIKRRAKTVEDPAERKRLDVQATALKLVLNSTFGKLGDPFSSLFDPSAFLAVTLSGQLMLIDLIEQLTAVGVRVLSANTDGLFIKVSRKNRRWRKILKEWETATAMSLEVDPLKRLAVLASNRFATLDNSGKIKRRGAGVKGDLSPVAAPNSLVVADAVVEALLRDVTPEKTIGECRDPVRFCSVTQRSGKVKAAVLVNEPDGREIELPKVARWYKAHRSSCRIVHRFEDGRHTTPSNATGVNLALDLVAGQLPEDLDHGWYIAQARKVVQGCPGYHHRSRKRLGDHAPALEVHARGLAPVPKWKGKAQPKGADRSIPTYLWDWPRYQTFGTHTGPKVGILVVDVDKAVLFKKWVDRGNSPLLENRWQDLDGCLTSCRGEATPELVRTGRARGKLIFRLADDGSHPLVKVAQDHWLKSRGVEIFYGRGMPTVLGSHPDGTEYRLDGVLGDAPAWLLEGLIPTKRLNGKRESIVSRVKAQAPPGTNGQHQEPALVDQALLEGLPKELAALAPELGKFSVGWRIKELGDERTIWVGRCPFPHDSGSSSDGDLSAGYNQDGRPYVRCMHGTCVEIPALDARLKDAFRPTFRPTVELPSIEPTPLSLVFAADLDARRVAFHKAPTGCGKSYAAAKVLAIRYRLGKATLVAVPTKRTAKEIGDWLREFAPDAFDADTVARVYGRMHLPVEGADLESDGDDDEADSYPIHPGTRIVIATHAQLLRRGFSRFNRPIWTKLGSSPDEKEPRPAFDLILDEPAELIRACRRELAVRHRVTRRDEPDGTGGRLVPRLDCPKSNRSGNCANCELREGGGEMRFNVYGIREVDQPRQIEVDTGGESLRRPRRPLVINLDDLDCDPPERIASTTYAARVHRWQSQPIDEMTRRTAPIYLYQSDKDGKQPRETNDEILGHMLEHAFLPVLTCEYPVDSEGNPVDPETLKKRIAAKDKRWDEDVIFPWRTCQTPHLLFTDMAGLEQIRRFAVQERVGIVFTGATMSSADMRVLTEVWPELAVQHHAYTERKIRQIALVFPEGYHGPDSLLGADRRLITEPLETLGRGVIFCARKAIARSLYDVAKVAHPELWLVEENDRWVMLGGGLHEGPVETRCTVTYCRGVLGLGANVLGIRFLVVDARAFRPVASFNPAEITPEEYERTKAEERLATIEQNLGRAIRGEPGKTVVLILLNADEPLKAALQESEAIIQGSELPPVVAEGGRDLPQIVDQARRWLEAGGGDWPDKDPNKTNTKRAGRPKGSTKRTKESILEAAEAALEAGETWSDFARRENVRRVLSPEEMGELKARFNAPDPPEPGKPSV
jgi:hypothetical protein